MKTFKQDIEIKSLQMVIVMSFNPFNPGWHLKMPYRTKKKFFAFYRYIYHMMCFEKKKEDLNDVQMALIYAAATLKNATRLT
jgi:hypothetical protein